MTVAKWALTAGVSAMLALSAIPGVAAAKPPPAPLQPGNAWPGCPPDNPSGPCRWCPGDPPVQTGNRVTNPVVWDENVCHTYWYVYSGQGNVAQNIFEGETPPPPPPPGPPAIIGDYQDCLQKLGALSVLCPKG